MRLKERGARILGPYSWPYGVDTVESKTKLLNWAERFDLRLSSSNCKGLHWLRIGRCTIPSCGAELVPNWMNHRTNWNYKSKPAVITTHTYVLNDDDLRKLAELSREFEVLIHGESWYGFGSFAVEVWDKAVYQEVLGSQ